MKQLIFFPIIVTACASDTTVDEFYEPFSPSTIQVIYKFDPIDSTTLNAFAYTNIPHDQTVSRNVAASSQGSFFLDLEIDRPTKSIVNLGPTQYNIFIFPHDTTKVVINSASEFDLSFEGNSSAINKYYLEKRKALGYADKRLPLLPEFTSKGSYKRLGEVADSITAQESSFFTNYHSLKNLPQWFQDYEKAEIFYSCAGIKTALPHLNEIAHYFEDSLTSNYFNFLGEIPIDNKSAFLSSYYFWFLSDYFLRDLPVKETKDLNGLERATTTAKHTLTLSSLELTGRNKRLFQLFQFSSLARFLPDSAAVDSASKAFEIDPTVLMRLVGTRSSLALRGSGPIKGDTIPDFVAVDRLDSVVSIRDFQNKIVFINFWAPWCGPCLKDIPEINKLAMTYKDNPDVILLNVCIDSEKSKWLISLDNNGLLGLHLKAEGNWNSLIRSYFGIQGIPHHTILAKNNIVHENFSSISKETMDALLTNKK